MLSRELAYTALTRARKKLILLVEGDDPSVLLDLTRAERSETARRNTNLFALTAVRRPGEEQPFAEHLRHRASDGTLVRSKSEVVILNRILERFGQDVFQYEQRLPGVVTGGRLLPDFTAVDRRRRADRAGAPGDAGRAELPGIVGVEAAVVRGERVRRRSDAIHHR